MIRSMTYLSKISKTKKRLSKEHWFLSGTLIAIMGLYAILSFSMRIVTLPGSYSEVRLDIPVVSVPIDDPTMHNFDEQSVDAIAKTSATVVMTDDAFFFGDMKAFTTDFSQAKNKYVVKHIEGEPQLLTLINSMEKWFEDRRTHHNIRNDDIVIFLPAGNIPMPIVIQVVAGLRDSGLHKRIVLGGGLM